MGFEMGLLYQTMTFALLKIVAENEDERSVNVSTRGNALRLRVVGSTGDVMMTVYGEGYDEAGEQLMLACLQRISVQRLRELHNTPLKKGTPVTLAKG